MVKKCPCGVKVEKRAHGRAKIGRWGGDVKEVRRYDRAWGWNPTVVRNCYEVLHRVGKKGAECGVATRGKSYAKGRGGALGVAALHLRKSRNSTSQAAFKFKLENST
jgi:hypothetical protein